MTLETYSILLNTTIGVLIIGYGIWLRNVFQHQIKAKDATIETKDAEISRLRGETAPSIADAYAKMRAHAESMTADVTDLTQNLDASRKTQPQFFLLMEIGALDEVLEHMKSLVGPGPTPAMPLDKAFAETFGFVVEQIEQRGARWRELNAEFRQGG